MKPCKVCGLRPRVVTETDLVGRATYREVPCAHMQRHAARLCADCGVPHGGHSQRLRCEPCKAANNVERCRRYRRNSPAKARAAQARWKAKNMAAVARRKREWRHADPARMVRDKERVTRMYHTFGAPGYAARKAYEAEYREKHRERIRLRQAAYRERIRQQDRAA